MKQTLTEPSPHFLLDENERLQELYAYEILDTTSEEDFDELVELAAQVAECPIASITFVDRNRQWFKSRLGDPTRETPRDISFCTHTIRRDEVMIVEDPTLDERFVHNPDVTGGLRIGFYAGVPIYSSRGFKLGTVCVIDHKPRQLSESQIASLKIISRQVSQLLELRLRNKMIREDAARILEQTEKSYEAYFCDEGIARLIYESESLRIVQVNDAAIERYGYSRSEFLNLTVFELRDLEEKKQINQLVRGLAQESKSITFETVHRRKGGDAMPVEVTVTNILYKGRRARLATINDIHEKIGLREKVSRAHDTMKKLVDQAMQNAQEKERDLIGKELHDNISQIMSSTRLLLEVAESNPELKDDMIRLSKDNISAAIQEIRALSKSLVGGEKEDFLLNDAVEELVRSYRIVNNFEVSYSCTGYVEELPDDVKLTVFRIIQESMHNATKHAHATRVSLDITLEDQLLVSIRDNGQGFDTACRRAGIGINNIRHRVQFYNGDVDIISAPGKGCAVLVQLPVAGMGQEVIPGSARA